MQATYNIAATLDEQASKFPYQKAVIVPVKHQKNGRIAYEHFTYQHLAIASQVYAKLLTEEGLRKGSRCIVMLKPSLEFFAITFGLFRIGAVPVFIDPGIGLKHLKRCIADAEAEAFIGIAKAHVARILFGWGKATLRKHLVVGPRLTFWVRRLPPVAPSLHHHEARNRHPAVLPDDPAAILFTSGSTGVPKGAVYSHGNFRAQIEMLRNTYRIQSGEFDLCTFPLFALFAPALGMSAVVPEMDFTKPAQVEPQRLYEALDNFGISNLFGSPALLKRFAIAARADGRTFPSLKRIVTAGAPVPYETLALARAVISEHAHIYTPYGATEALPVANIESNVILSETHLMTKQGAGICVGQPLPQVDLKIIQIHDDELPQFHQDLLVNQGEIGEIIVRGPQVTRTYFNRQDSTRLAKIAIDGSSDVYHRMGDLGYLDQKGRLWYCGRKSHRVVTAEGTYYTIPCEAIFNQHRDVKRSALVGVKRGQSMQPMIIVETEQPLKESERQRVAHQLRELAVSFEHTKSISVFLFHDSFPVDIRHNSKIFREKLADWATKELT